MKRIVVCIDGTWNEFYNESLEEGGGWTNVHHLRTLVAERDKNADVAQIVHYIKGVGTHTAPGSQQPLLIRKFKEWNRQLDGAIGFGINELIIDGYLCLCDNFEDGDEIYLFGFSRGAVAARALAGLIAQCGLLKGGRMNEFPAIWRSFSGQSKGDFPSSWLHESRTVVCVGVWDSVRGNVLARTRTGLTWGKKIFGYGRSSPVSDREALIYERTVTQELDGLHFRSTHISPNVSVSLQALSLDERRVAFEPIIWTIGNTIDAEGKVLSQVLFPGDHSSVGGGHEDASISNLSLDWMLRSVRENTSLKFHRRPDSLLKMPGNKSCLAVEPEKWGLQMARRSFAARPDGIYYGDRLVPNCKVHSSVMALKNKPLEMIVEGGKYTGNKKIYEPYICTDGINGELISDVDMIGKIHDGFRERVGSGSIPDSD